MTVSTTTSRADYNGNGTTTAFAVPFYFLDNSHLTVLRTQISTGVITTLAITTNYTVTGAGVPAGGTVTCLVAPTTDQRISILRNVPFTQLNTYVPNDPFPAASHERALDQLTMEVQQLDEAVDRALTLPANTATGTVSATLPTPAANQVIGWNGTSSGLQNFNAQTLASIVSSGNTYSDLFSGDGVQTTFTLSANPGSISNLHVSISGVTQRPSIDYTWIGGTTLTISPAPAAGTNNILVRYNNALPQGVSTKDAQSFDTVASASATAIDISVNHIRTAGYYAAGDGGGALYRRRTGIPAHSGYFTSNSGTVVWELDSQFISVRQFGAKGDGSTNDTAAFDGAWNAVAAGGQINVPNGVYMLDYIDGINKQVHWRLDGGAVLKQRVPANAAVTLDANWGIFEFVAGSAGSTVKGGTFDGNRAALAQYYDGDTRLGQDNHWWGIRTDYVNDIVIEDIVFKNVMNEAFYFYGGERNRAKNIRVYDSGVAFNVQGAQTYSSGYDIEVYAEGIGNVISGTMYYFFQHGAAFGWLRNSRLKFDIKNFYASKGGTDGASPVNGGKEPVPIALNMYAFFNCNISANANEYSATGGTAGLAQAFNFSSVDNSIMDLSCFDYEVGLTAGTAQNCDITLDLDGNYKAITANIMWGLLVTIGGVFPVVGSGLAGETNANNTSRGITFSGRVTRFGVGVRDEGANNTYSPGFESSANVTDGFQLAGPTGDSQSYPVARTRPNGGRKLLGVRANFNGQSGLTYVRGENDLVAYGEFRDNGQQLGARVYPYGIHVLAAAGEGKGLRIIGADVDASATVIDTDGISYLPGASTAVPTDTRYDANDDCTNQYDFIARNPNHYHVGQWITLKQVLTGATDSVGKIINISADILTIAFLTSRTFVDKLANLTGTGTTSGTTLTGSSTLFTTQVDFPVYLKNGVNYRRIVYVTNNTTAVIDSAFASNLSGATLQVVKATAETGFLKPTLGVVVNDSVTVGPFLLRDCKAKNVANQINYLSFPGLDQGSRFEFDFSLAMAGTALANSVVSGLPRYSQVQNIRCTFTTAITGITGGASVEIRENGVTLKTAISGFPALTAGIVTYGPTPDVAAFSHPNLGDIFFVSTAGNPTGTITVRVTLEKYSWTG